MSVPEEAHTFDISFVGYPDCDENAQCDCHTEHTYVCEAVDLHELTRTHQVKLRWLTVVLEDLCVVVFGDEVSGANRKVVLPSQAYRCRLE